MAPTSQLCGDLKITKCLLLGVGGQAKLEIKVDHTIQLECFMITLRNTKKQWITTSNSYKSAKVSMIVMDKPLPITALELIINFSAKLTLNSRKKLSNITLNIKT